jgi:hypothetical protein
MFIRGFDEVVSQMVMILWSDPENIPPKHLDICFTYRMKLKSNKFMKYDYCNDDF